MNLLMLVIATVVAYAAAFNRGRPPALLLASLLLALVLVSVAFPWLMLKKLSLKRRVPKVAQVGENLSIEVTLRNPTWVPRVMVEVDDIWKPARESGNKNLSTEQLIVPLGLVPWLGANSSKSIQVSLPCNRRGAWSIGPARLKCSFPLGVLERSSTETGSEKPLLVYPRLFEVRGIPVAGSQEETNKDELPLKKPYGEDEFQGIRGYRRGDSLRHVHWHATARQNRLMVREFEPVAAPRVCLAMDLSEIGRVGEGADSTTEIAISIGASISRWAVKQGIPLRVTATTEELAAPSPVDGVLGSPEETDPLLTWFASVSTAWKTPYSAVLSNTAATTHAGETVVVFLTPTAHGSVDIVAGLNALKDAGAFVVAVLFEPVSFVLEGPLPQYLTSKEELTSYLTSADIPFTEIGLNTDLSDKFK